MLYEHQNPVITGFSRYYPKYTNFSTTKNELLTMEATMNKKTKALTTEQYREIIQTMREGFSGCRPNERIATALVLEVN